MTATRFRCRCTGLFIAGRLLLLTAAGLLSPATAGAQDAADEPKTTILHRAGPWRVMYSLTLPQISTAEGIQPRILKPAREVIVSDMAGFDFLTAWPPDGWTAADFDDAGWAREHFFLPFPNGQCDGRAGGGAPTYYTRQISLRGKFNVTDPEKVAGLTLELAYRGGVVVYLNGKELARAHLPKGTLERGALAGAYPDNVTFKPDGAIWSWYTDSKEIQDIYPLRVRRLEKVVVPAALLRKGTNVLAVEIHSSPYPDAFLNYRNRIPWVPCGLVELALEADGPDGIVPNVTRPKGVQVWNANLLETVHDIDWADPIEPLAPVRLAVPRNGRCTGRVVVGSDQPIEGLRAAVSDLAGPAGAGIPAKDIRVSYGAFDGVGSRGALYSNMYGVVRDDGLLEEPPAVVPVSDTRVPAPFVAGAVQPVYLTVRVPKDAAAGVYRGTLDVRAAGGVAVRAPVELTVIDWTLPDPAEFAYWCGMVEAPEGPAVHYDVPLWSDRHWELIGKGFDWIAQFGSKVLFIPLAAQSELGNAEGMVRFTRGEGGKLTADLSIVEKYVDVALAHLGKPRYVVCGVWQRCEQGRTADAAAGCPLLTVVAEGGGIETVDGPAHGTDAEVALWKPVLAGIDALLARRGLAGTLVLGMGDDMLPNEATATAFHEALPAAGWYAGRHVFGTTAIRRSGGTVPVVYQVNVYGGGHVPDPAEKRLYGWRNGYAVPGGLQVWVMRSVYDTASAAKFRWLPEAMLMSDRRGQGAIGADFWPPRDGRGGRRGVTLFSRFPRSANVGAGGKGITATQLLYPGPDGPVPTVRFEAMREGIQEAEARIFLERLLTEDPCRLPADVAARAQQILDERARRARLLMDDQGVEWFKSPLLAPASGWQARSGRLYEAAAAAAACCH